MVTSIANNLPTVTASSPGREAWRDLAGLSARRWQCEVERDDPAPLGLREAGQYVDDWEPEHGLQIVFRDGRAVTKVGPYGGHLTNSAAHADDTLDGIVYYRR
jgi:hypothetical protein